VPRATASFTLPPLLLDTTICPKHGYRWLLTLRKVASIKCARLNDGVTIESLGIVDTRLFPNSNGEFEHHFAEGVSPNIHRGVERFFLSRGVPRAARVFFQEPALNYLEALQ
jgi:hypothetical protein